MLPTEVFISHSNEDHEAADYQPCDLGNLAWLKLMQMVDFAESFPDGCRDLLRIWGVGLDPRRLED